MPNTFWSRVQPRDIIATIVLTGIMLLFAIGKNGWLQIAGSMILAYYFLRRGNHEIKMQQNP